MKRWYVVQVFAGYEEHVKVDLVKHIAHQGLQDLFGEILIPSVKVKRLFEASDDAQNQQLFPGYILLEMELVPQAIRLVTTTPRVMRFLGGKDPAPLSTKEIERIISQVKGEVKVVAPAKSEFIEGTEIEIADGPFSGFVGLVDKVDKDTEKLTVMVSIFGRSTPVELRFDQVKQ